MVVCLPYPSPYSSYLCFVILREIDSESLRQAWDFGQASPLQKQHDFANGTIG